MLFRSPKNRGYRKIADTGLEQQALLVEFVKRTSGTALTATVFTVAFPDSNGLPRLFPLHAASAQLVLPLIPTIEYKNLQVLQFS